MQRPSTGELLAGLAHALETEVLAALPDGAARRQLKAAVHLIARLERTWDLAPAHLAADNADIEGTLAALGHDNLPAEATAPPGYNDPALRALAACNLTLHQALLDLPDCAELQALRRRMAARDCAFVGDRSPEHCA